LTHSDHPSEIAPVAPELFVPDVMAAVDFYTETLGFTRHRVEPTFGIVGMGEAIVMFADERMYGAMGGRAGSPAQRGAFIDIRIMVEDVDAAYQRYKNGGLEIVHDIADRPYGLRDFIVKDLNGFRLRFASVLR
jgi:predicted enzyme related to lactoylglutathione lyase